MKSSLFISSIVVALGLSSCTTYNTYYNGYTDDVYGSAPVAPAPPQQVGQESPPPPPPAPASSSRVESEGNTYITNNYNGDSYADYEYSSRIRRFYRPISYDYYDSYYTNRYWYDYDPYYYGVSIYSCYGWRRPSWTWGVSFGYGWNYPNYYSAFYNPYWGGYGYYNGFNHHHHHNDGGYWTTNYNNHRDENVHYGPRGTVNSSNGRGNSSNGNRVSDNERPSQRSLVTYTSGRSNSNARPSSSGSGGSVERTPSQARPSGSTSRPNIGGRVPSSRPGSVARPSNGGRAPAVRPSVTPGSSSPRTVTPRVNTPSPRTVTPRVNTPSNPRINNSRQNNSRSGTSYRGGSSSSRSSGTRATNSRGSNRSSGSISNGSRSPR